MSCCNTRIIQLPGGGTVDLGTLTPTQITQLTENIDFTQLTAQQLTELSQVVDYTQLSATQLADLQAAIAAMPLDFQDNIVFNGPGPKVATFNGDIKVTGLIDPTGVVFIPVASNPGDDATIWINSADGKLYRGNEPTSVEDANADFSALTPAEVADLQAALGLPENHASITSIDLKSTGNPNEYIVEVVWVDSDGNTQTTTDPTPITVSSVATASDVGNVPSGNLAATNVQDALNELQADIDTLATGGEPNVQVDWNETNTASDAYILNKPTIPSTAADIANVPSGNLAATDVQGALNELQGDIDALAADSHPAATVGTAPAGLAIDPSTQVIDLSLTAADIALADTANNYTATDIEGALAEIATSLTGIAHTAITNIDLQPTGTPNEYTVVIEWTDENGAAQTTTDATPITITGGVAGSVTEEAATTGTVDVVLGADTGNAILSIPEQETLASQATPETDPVNDLMTIWDTDAGKHVQVPLDSVGLAAQIINNYFNAGSFPATPGTDVIALSQNHPGSPGWGQSWMHDGRIWSYGDQVRGNGVVAGAQYESGSIIGFNAHRIDTGAPVGRIPLFEKYWQNAHNMFAIDQNQKVWSLGENDRGQLGHAVVGDTENESFTLIPFFEDGGINIVDMAISAHDNAEDVGTAVLALADDGALYAWGSGEHGVLGLGSTTNQIAPQPVPLPPGVAIKKILMGPSDTFTHSTILMDNGDLYVAGANNWGQLGLGNTTEQWSFVLSRQNVLDVIIGTSVTVVIDADGSVWATGNNGHGFFGNGTLTSSNTWVQNTSFTGIAKNLQITHATSTIQSLYIHDNADTLWVVGNNGFGQLGTNTTTNANVTTTIQLAVADAPFQGNIQSVMTSGGGTIVGWVLDKDGVVWSAGVNSSGAREIGILDDSFTTRNRWRISPLQEKVLAMRATGHWDWPSAQLLTERGDLYSGGTTEQHTRGLTGWSANFQIVDWQRRALPAP